ncbi:hypothetical protein ACHAXT_006705 [Thalassiosira profunda]
MDGMQSWSSFERQRKAGGGDGGTSGAALDTSGSKGIEALYVSSSAPDVAPAAASLLRHSGLAAPGSSNTSGDDAGDSQRTKDDEFKLRFHWMRPHPSLAFAQMDGEGGAGIKSDDAEYSSEQSRRKRDAGDQNNPVVESAKLMEAYRYSQVKKLAGAAGKSEDKGDGDEPDPGNSPTAESGNASNPDTATVPDLPLELPKLRINLANLVEPPLMSSWLPGEETGI